VNSSGAVAGLGLLSAATWGGSDFIGGLGARRSPALLVVASGHIFSVLVLLAICLGFRLPLPGSHYLLYAALGGFEASIALAIFYRALAMGAMGLTAALTGLLTALIPVLFSLIHDGLPTPLTAAGLAMGMLAIWLITRSPEEKNQTPHRSEKCRVPHPFRVLCEMGGKPQNSTTPAFEIKTTPATKSIPAPRTALLLGALAGIGFGTQLSLFKFASSGGVLWTLTSARAAGSISLILVLVAMPPKEKWSGFWLTGIAAGALDTIGVLFFLRATQIGRLDVAALVCSLYPAGTILLAALVLHERPSRSQFAGIALALAAVVLISV
jgi:drug/metabolite transporter (DMT)-like permease